MTNPKRKKTVKKRGQKWEVRGYAVMDMEGNLCPKLLPGEIVVAETKDTGEWMMIDCPIFKKKRDAEQFRDGVESWETIPCTITYEI